MIKYQTVLLAASIGIVPAMGGVWWFLRNGRNGLGKRLPLTVFFWGVLTAIPASIFQMD